MFLGYPVLSEWLSHGKTIGKLIMGLRAVRDDGGPLSFRQAFIRGLTGHDHREARTAAPAVHERRRDHDADQLRRTSGSAT